MPRLPSASKLQLAMTCAGSAVYERADNVSVYGETGSDIHAFMRALSSMSRDEALERLPDALRERCEAIDLEALPVSHWQAEMAFAYDVETEQVRFLGHDIGRNYGPRESDTELFVSIDAYAHDEAVGDVFVGDWKTGRGKVEPVASNWQLRLGALAAARHAGVERVRAAVVQLPEGGLPFVDLVEWDEFDLSMFAAELRELVRRLQAPERVVPVRVGCLRSLRCPPRSSSRASWRC
jgi:hypothetical protein